MSHPAVPEPKRSRSSPPKWPSGDCKIVLQTSLSPKELQRLVRNAFRGSDVAPIVHQDDNDGLGEYSAFHVVIPSLGMVAFVAYAGAPDKSTNVVVDAGEPVGRAITNLWPIFKEAHTKLTWIHPDGKGVDLQPAKKGVRHVEIYQSARLKSVWQAKALLSPSEVAAFAKLQQRRDAIAWLIRAYPLLQDAQIAKLVGSTRSSVRSVRDGTHWNKFVLHPRDPVTLGLCSEKALNDAVLNARKGAKKRVTLRGEEIFSSFRGKFSAKSNIMIIPKGASKSASKGSRTASLVSRKREE